MNCKQITLIYLLHTVKNYLHIVPISQGSLFLMIGSLEVMHELMFTIPSVIQISSIGSINSILLRFNLGKPRIF